MNAKANARAYVAAQPPAVSGCRGHNNTFRVACHLVGFGLRDSEVLDLLREFNARCQPPWTEKELRHKVRDARKTVRLLRRPSAPTPVRLSWKLEWFAVTRATTSPVPHPPRQPSAAVPVVSAVKELPTPEARAAVRVHLSVEGASVDLPL